MYARCTRTAIEYTPPFWSSSAMEITELAAMVKKNGRVCCYASRYCALFVEASAVVVL